MTALITESMQKKSIQNQVEGQNKEIPTEKLMESTSQQQENDKANENANGEVEQHKQNEELKNTSNPQDQIDSDTSKKQNPQLEERKHEIINDGISSSEQKVESPEISATNQNDQGQLMTRSSKDSQEPKTIHDNENEEQKEPLERSNESATPSNQQKENEGEQSSPERKRNISMSINSMIYRMTKLAHTENDKDKSAVNDDQSGLSKLKQVTNNLIITQSPAQTQPVIKQVQTLEIPITKELIDLAQKVQGLWKIKKAKKILKDMQKRAEFRKNVITELVVTEEKYVSDLTQIINNIKKPLTSTNILDSKEIEEIFSNIEEVRNLNQSFLSDLKKRFQSYNYWTKIADVSLSIIPFFKIYFVYWNNYIKSSKTLDLLRQKNPEFAKFLSEAERSKKLPNSDLASNLIKPVQRLPQYELIFKELLQKTFQQHPDYLNIVEALEKFQKVNSQNNSQLERYIMNAKMFDLDNCYGQHISIIDSQRLFQWEEKVTIFTDQQSTKHCMAYFLSDLIIFAEILSPENFTYYTHVLLNEGSFVKDVPNFKYFQNLFSIKGKNTAVSFICENEGTQQRMMNQIQEIVEDLRQNTIQKYYQSRQMQQNMPLNLSPSPGSSVSSYNEEVVLNSIDFIIHPIIVNVIGTQQRSLNSDRHTIYIIEITIGAIVQKIFVRFSEMLSLEELVEKRIPKLEFSELKKSQSIWGKLLERKTKLIEVRKLQIQNFLQSLLTSELVRDSEHLQEILVFLNLPKNFYHLPKIMNLGNEDETDLILKSIIEKDEPPAQNGTIEEEQIKFESVISGRTSSTSGGNSFNRLSINRSPGLYHQSNTNEYNSIKPEEDASPNGRFSLMRVTRDDGSDGNFMSIDVSCMDDTVLTIKFNQNSKTFDICQDLAKQIRLKDFHDFRLYLKQQNEVKVLDEDEIIFKLLNIKPSQVKDLSAALDKMKKIQNEKKSFIFQKYLWYTPNKEEEEYQSDPVRLRLLSSQIFRDFHILNFMISVDQCAMFSAFFIYIYHNIEFKMDNMDDKNQQKMYDITKHLIPVNSNESDYKKNQHTDQIIEQFQMIHQEIESLLLEMQNEQEDPVVIMLQQDRILFYHMMVLNSIRMYSFFGISWFLVQPYGDTLKEAQKNSIVLSENLYLGISINKIYFRSQIKKEIALQNFDLNDLQDYDLYPTAIILNFQIEGFNNYRFDTFQSYEIAQLIQIYRDINVLNSFEGVKNRGSDSSPLSNLLNNRQSL